MKNETFLEYKVMRTQVGIQLFKKKKGQKRTQQPRKIIWLPGNQ